MNTTATVAPISISIVEDEPETRESLVALLSEESRVRYLNCYATGEAALEGIPRDQPDVAMVDINLPKMSGIACVARLKTMMPKLQVLMLTTYTDRHLIFDSLKAGACGYLLKNTCYAQLVQAVEEVHAGGSPMSMEIARKVVSHFHSLRKPSSDVDKLSPREQEILALIAKGRLYKEISESLGISLGTVRTYLGRIYEKLHVQSRTEAAVKYLGGN
jgi:DNA-binding NarL/FixJ family response regulator